ncbi:MAG: hypothetical protein ACM65L_24350 [Microcoleus sp.]
MVYHKSQGFNSKMKKGGNPNLGWKVDKGIAYARTPVQLKVMPGVRERLMTVDDWQNKVRRFIDELLAEQGD